MRHLRFSLPFALLAALPGQAWQIASTTGFTGHQMVYDSARDRIVRLSHAENGARLFEWDGTAWHHRPASNGPTTTASTVIRLAYDGARRRTVALIAGSTWLWDGGRWQQAASSGPGTGDTGTALMAWDARRQVVVYREPSTGTTHEWDGSSWRAVPGPLGPFPDLYPCLGHDPVTQRVVATIPRFQTAFTWDGQNWIPVPNARVPYELPQTDMAVATDPTTNRLYMFGGTRRSGSTPAWDDTVWCWDGGNWNLVGAGLPRRRATMAPFPTTGALLIFGGDADLVYLDTWSVDLTNGFRPLDEQPVMMSMAVDPPRQRLVGIGYEGYPVRYRTWEWTGSRWRQLFPATTFGGVLVHDPVRGQMLAIENDLYSPTVRTRALTATGWELLTSATEPGWESHFALAADPLRQVVVRFGALHGTWEWDGTGWTRRPTAHEPVLGWNSQTVALAFDPHAQRIRLLADATAGRQEWEYDGVDWTLVATSGLPTVSRGSLRWDAVTGRMIYAAGDQSGEGTWERIGTGWVRIDARGAYPQTIASDPQRQVLVAYQQGTWFALRSDLAAIGSYGLGCGVGVAPWLRGAGRPSPVGGSFRLELGDLPPSAPTAIYAALAPDQAPLGGGCTLLLQTPVHFANTVASATGSASAPVALPANPTLVGLDVFWQAAALQAAGPLLGAAVLTDGVRTHLGV